MSSRRLEQVYYLCMRAAPVMVILVGGLAGCAGAGPACTSAITVTVSPLSGVADHASAAPGNQQKFTATAVSTASPGCAAPAVVPVLTPAWTSSDPLDVTVSSAADSTNGLATCVNATAAPVTLTATGGAGASSYAKTATLSCK